MLRRTFLSLALGVAATMAAGCGKPATEQTGPEAAPTTAPDAAPTQPETEDQTMLISVTDDEHTVTYQLNDTSAARSLYAQLPLAVEVGEFSDNEKTFTPADGLDTSDVIDSAGRVGDIAYFSPWGDVAMYYGHDAGPYQGLYGLGQAIEGADQVALLAGTITVTAHH